MIHDQDTLVARTVQMVTEGVVEAVDGTRIPIEADTVLLHGDGADAVRNARAIREALLRAGVVIAPVTEVLAAKEEKESASCPA